MELTVVIPTRDRLPILLETLARLGRQRGDVAFEAIVVDDGSTDGTRAALEREVERTPYDLTVIETPGTGPAVARNRAIDRARAPVCLFINDDAWPREDLLERHRDFHRRRPEQQAALLGRMTLPPEPPPSPFMRWLADAHFDYDEIRDHANAGGKRFFTANVSAKTAFVQGAGGFDESFRAAAHEDIDLGLRLEAAGMRLAYDPDAVVEHCHPKDLAMAIDHCLMVGRTLAPFVERYPDRAVPLRPGLRHRVKASALTVLAALGVRTPGVQRETWRFLCHEAAREAYWSAVDRRARGEEPPAEPLRIGRTLARLASRDRDTWLPIGELTQPAEDPAAATYAGSPGRA
ncbi:MAG TPA: glycosyltransferase [Solirubrobacteraceae bacterium]|nr:glycosyltransferase [Solirubrobacteraceae bacterium]